MISKVNTVNDSDAMRMHQKKPPTAPSPILQVAPETPTDFLQRMGRCFAYKTKVL